MSLRRRAGAPRLIEWTGERCVPWSPDVQVVYEHMHRYLWAAKLVAGRRVLELGSGEGFGASILADGASEVLGIDIDERTVEHARLNWSGPSLSFEVGSALDLSAFDDGSFDAVVAFEIIEHVAEQEQMLAEVERVLTSDGVLIVSTPDRRLYSEATGQKNPFHERELTREEFSNLLEESFENVGLWGQRTITGSHLGALGGSASETRSSAAAFFIERAGEEWRIAGEPVGLYLVALASNGSLPAAPSVSTLGDCDLELVRAAEMNAADAAKAIAVQRDESLEREQIARITMERERSETAAERERAKLERERERSETAAERERAELVQEQTRVALAMRDEYVRHRQAQIDELRVRLEGTEGNLASLSEELEQARRLNRRVEESVTWQTFQRARGRVFSSIGETSFFARALRFSLRLAGRALIRRQPQASSMRPSEAEPLDAPGQRIELPTFDQPQVSLVIPLFAAADLTRRCLETIRDNTLVVGYEVILVDDTADADTKQLLEMVSGPQVLVNEENEGYLRSVNRGAALARGKWIVLCNNDIEVQPGWLEAMLDCAESDEIVGIVAPKFISPDGSLSEAGGIIWNDGTGVNFGRGDDPGLFQYEYRREVDYGSAAALMVSAELWREIGGFDELYSPMYYEDTDLCFQARERGWRVLYEPEAVIVHVEGATAGKGLESGHKRHQELNRPKFVAKWRKQLESEHMRPAPTNVRRAANRHRGPHVLVIDHGVPTWDRDSGSLRMMGIMRTLLDLGARVSFIPDNFSPLQPYTRLLQRMGIDVFYGQLDVNAELATIGPRLSMVILSRPHVASRWLDVLREFAPAATIVYDTVDLHWLREARRAGRDVSAKSLDNGRGALDELPPKAQALRHLELAMIRASDLSLAVTEDECAQIQRDVPGAEVRVVPNIHDVQPQVPPPEDRAGILFVGGFVHPPNVDAALHLVNDVMSEVWRELGDVRVSIVGADAPAEVRALASPLVDVLGWVEDLQPLLDGSRLMLAPLRYGAGMKGKVTQCLAAGLPVVTTSVGAEGLQSLIDGEPSEEEALLVSDTPRELAAHVVRLYRDQDLWCSLSRSGQRLIGELCSTEVVARRLDLLLRGEHAPGKIATPRHS